MIYDLRIVVELRHCENSREFEAIFEFEQKNYVLKQTDYFKSRKSFFVMTVYNETGCKIKPAFLVLFVEVQAGNTAGLLIKKY